MNLLYPGHYDGKNQVAPPDLFSFLLSYYPQQLQDKVPKEELYASCLRQIFGAVSPEHRLYIVDMSNYGLFTIDEMAAWAGACLACSIPAKVYKYSYEELVNVVYRHDPETTERYNNSSYFVLTFPEVVTSADWARSKLLQLFLKKKVLLIFTSDIVGAKTVFGDTLNKMLDKDAVTIEL